MYNPHLFREERPEVLASLIRSVQFAALITPTHDGLQISHVPTVLKNSDGPVERWVVECHIAKPNPHGPAAASAVGETVALYQGPQAYITPSWYPSKQEHGKAVPTWNYAIVHLHGTLELIEDEAWLKRHVGELTEANEGAREKPWAVSDAPDDFVRGMLRGIVGLRLRVSRAEGKWKMSQNRNAADRQGAIQGLAREIGDADPLVLTMRQVADQRQD